MKYIVLIVLFCISSFQIDAAIFGGRVVTVKHGSVKPLDKALVVLSSPTNGRTSISNEKGEFKTQYIDGKFNISVTVKGYQLFFGEVNLEQDLENAIIILQPTKTKASIIEKTKTPKLKDYTIIQYTDKRLYFGKVDSIESLDMIRELFGLRNWLSEVHKDSASYVMMDSLELFHFSDDYWKNRVKEKTFTCELTFQETVSSKHYFMSPVNGYDGISYQKSYRLIPNDLYPIKYKIYEKGNEYYLKLYGKKHQTQRYLIQTSPITRWEGNLDWKIKLKKYKSRQ